MQVTTTALNPGQSLPLVLKPDAQSQQHTTAQFLEWVSGSRSWIVEHVAHHGGLLFRGFNLSDATQFEAFNDAMGFELMEYIRGNTPRSVVRNKVYTSTEVQRFVPIPLHNEMSYTAKYPSAIAFLCITPSPIGGGTPIADMHEVWAQMPPRIRDTFAERGLKYTQIVTKRPGRFMKRTWTEMFYTEDMAEVERLCAQQGIAVEWGRRQKLKLNHVRPAVLEHPRTGKKIWFNQAHIFHPSFSRELKRIGLNLRAFLLGRYETFCRRRHPDGYPYNCTYGDGGVIPLEDIEEIRNILWRNAITFTWQQGDLVLLDNIQIAHSRMPYKGSRLVLTSLIKRVKAPTDAPTAAFPQVGVDTETTQPSQPESPSK